MKAFIAMNNNNYSFHAEVEGESINDCVRDFVRQFDEDKISGNDDLDKAIDDAVENSLERTYEVFRLVQYFNGCGSPVMVTVENGELDCGYVKDALKEVLSELQDSYEKKLAEARLQKKREQLEALKAELGEK